MGALFQDDWNKQQPNKAYDRQVYQYSDHGTDAGTPFKFSKFNPIKQKMHYGLAKH